MLDEYSLSQEIQLNIYRVLQEQLTNIVKHSNASSIEVRLDVNKALHFQISDNGVGFDVTTFKSGIGLANIKKRVELISGEITINSSPNKGCTIHIEIPLSNLKN